MQDARFGIDQMENDAAHFDYHFRGTLATLKGVWDQLLEEYNIKFGLGISLSQTLTPNSFRSEATRRSNSKAISFTNDYESERNRLLSDPKIDLLLKSHGVRDQEIHRQRSPRNLQLTLHENISVTAHFEARDAQGNLIGSSDSGPTSITSLPPQIKFYLSSWSADEIPDLCDYCLTEVTKFVTSLRIKYP